jgi:exosortase K
VRARPGAIGAAALVIWGLKRHYAEAGADDLWWILSPTARLVEILTGTDFVAVGSEGYVSHERLFVIEKSCAGVNFVVAAFGMLVFALFQRVRSSISGACVLGASLLAAYAGAVAVNAARITTAMWLADGSIALSALSPAQVHRIEGIAVYFAGLVVLYELVHRIERSAAAVGSRR